MSRRWMNVLIAALLIGALGVVTTGCTRVELETGEEGTSTSTSASVDLGDAEEADVRIEMGAGELSVGAGAREGKLMTADFDFSPSSWEPVVEHTLSGSLATLKVRQPRSSGFPIGRAENEWDVRLSDEVELDLAVSVGAGESQLELSGLDLRRLQLDIGAGDVTVDLSGEWEHDMHASIQGGAGSFRVLVPSTVGVRVTGSEAGLGTFEVDGLRREGDAYVNDAYGTAPVTIELDVTRGVGEVRVEVVD
jgi:hypothetical protein